MCIVSIDAAPATWLQVALIQEVMDLEQLAVDSVDKGHEPDATRLDKMILLVGSAPHTAGTVLAHCHCETCQKVAPVAQTAYEQASETRSCT